MGDWILSLGGLLFWLLAVLCLFRRDIVWRLYSLEPRWRQDNPERTDAWDEKTQRSAYIFVLLGIVFVALGLLI